LANGGRQGDPIQGAGDHEVEYFGGWVISAAMAVVTVLVLRHFQATKFRNPMLIKALRLYLAKKCGCISSTQAKKVC
jgi:hypothetical protein